MLKRLVAGFLLVTLTLAVSPSRAATSNGGLQASLQKAAANYLRERAKIEHISAVSVSVSIPGSASNIDATAGTVAFGGGVAVTPANIYQIGSNTKAFTSVALLQLEAEGKLDIRQTVGRWLPQYPAWKNVTIHTLLDMTSGIPTYDDQRAMLAAYAADPHKNWTPAQLIAFVYPKINPNVTWLYSNTAYLLAQLIVERASGHTYADEIDRRFLHNPALGLTSTYYQPDVYPPGVMQRMVSGYFFSNDPDNAGLGPLLGKDMKTLSLSWAQGAGGIVSTPEDVTRWSRALYEGPLLAPKQRAELETVVSQKTGKTIASASAQESHAFGLGVGQLYAPQVGKFWFYEGETLGYRMTYAYLPKSRIVVAVGLNSQPPKKEDHVGQLMSAIFAQLHKAGKI